MSDSLESAKLRRELIVGARITWALIAVFGVGLAVLLAIGFGWL